MTILDNIASLLEEQEGPYATILDAEKGLLSYTRGSTYSPQELETLFAGLENLIQSPAMDIETFKQEILQPILVPRMYQQAENQLSIEDLRCIVELKLHLLDLPIDISDATAQAQDLTNRLQDIHHQERARRAGIYKVMQKKLGEVITPGGYMNNTDIPGRRFTGLDFEEKMEQINIPTGQWLQIAQQALSLPEMAHDSAENPSPETLGVLTHDQQRIAELSYAPTEENFIISGINEELRQPAADMAYLLEAAFYNPQWEHVASKKADRIKAAFHHQDHINPKVTISDSITAQDATLATQALAQINHVFAHASSAKIEGINLENGALELKFYYQHSARNEYWESYPLESLDDIEKSLATRLAHWGGEIQVSEGGRTQTDAHATIKIDFSALSLPEKEILSAQGILNTLQVDPTQWDLFEKKQYIQKHCSEDYVKRYEAADIEKKLTYNAPVQSGEFISIPAWQADRNQQYQRASSSGKGNEWDALLSTPVDEITDEQKAAFLIAKKEVIKLLLEADQFEEYASRFPKDWAPIFTDKYGDVCIYLGQGLLPYSFIRKVEKLAEYGVSSLSEATLIDCLKNQKTFPDTALKDAAFGLTSLSDGSVAHYTRKNPERLLDLILTELAVTSLTETVILTDKSKPFLSFVKVEDTPEEFEDERYYEDETTTTLEIHSQPFIFPHDAGKLEVLRKLIQETLGAEVTFAHDSQFIRKDSSLLEPAKHYGRKLSEQEKSRLNSRHRRRAAALSPILYEVDTISLAITIPEKELSSSVDYMQLREKLEKAEIVDEFKQALKQAIGEISRILSPKEIIEAALQQNDYSQISQKELPILIQQAKKQQRLLPEELLEKVETLADAQPENKTLQSNYNKLLKHQQRMQKNGITAQLSELAENEKKPDPDSPLDNIKEQGNPFDQIQNLFQG